MTGGLFFALLTGLSWTGAGIIISCCAKGDFRLSSYSFLQTLFSGILSLLLFGSFSRFSFTQGVLLLCGTVFMAGVLNASAQFFVRRAMEKGTHAPIWAMMQCSMIFPFLAGILILGEKTQLLPLCGMFLMLAGILLPCLKGFANVRSYFAPALFALLLFGSAQILYLVCSCVKSFADPAHLRPALVCFGNMAAWSFLLRRGPEKKLFSRKEVLLAFLMAFVYAGGLYTFFRALDLLGGAGRGNIAVPLIMGTNIGAFSLYGIFVLKQKNSLPEIASVLAVLAGLFLLSFG